MQKERAAANAEEGRLADYLKDEVAMRLSERLLVSLPATLASKDIMLTRPRTSIDTSPRSSI